LDVSLDVAEGVVLDPHRRDLELGGPAVEDHRAAENPTAPAASCGDTLAGTLSPARSAHRIRVT
jgi:hypothetical protein